MLRKLIVRRLWLLAVFATVLFFATRHGFAQPAKLPAMTPSQFDQVMKLCKLKPSTNLLPPATAGGDPIISQRHCDPDWDAKMQCANDHFGKTGKIARTRFTSEWICQIAPAASSVM